ncbi:MAG: putative DNA binding domain-containing protein [Actinomycetia bacterium]|nr:putative DNA binding domain-containing protein [Actinomycetes bacterium]
MEPDELLAIISRGEDSAHQFKANAHNAVSIAEEMVAFSNSGEGQMLIGVTDDGDIAGLTQEDIRRINQLVANAASENVRPPINPHTENVPLPDGLVMIVTIPNGISKPYMTTQGSILVRCGSDKRKVTAREEIQRMFQSAGLIHGDETPANGLTPADIDMDYFRAFFKREYGERLDDQEVAFAQLLENMNLAKEGILNVAGAQLFAGRAHFRLPAFIVKAVSYPGTTIDEEDYLDSRDIMGKLADVFQQTLSFVVGNLRHTQGEKGVNAPGEPEIPRIALEELLTNALIHRDYFIAAPVRVFIFSDRVEIINPGHLPNDLTIENIKAGNSNIRNPVLASFATKILPYRGLGNGVRRALKAYPAIAFEDDHDRNLFKVTVARNPHEGGPG